MESLRDAVPMGAGAIAVSVGAYLPWLRINPDLPSDAEIPMVYMTGMNAGIGAFDFVLLASVALVLVLHAGSSRERLQTALTLLTGVGTVAFCASYLSGTSLAGFTATFVPALGWYLTVLGGVLLALAGGLQLPSIVRRGETTAAPIE